MCWIIKMHNNTLVCSQRKWLVSVLLWLFPTCCSLGAGKVFSFILNTGISFCAGQKKVNIYNNHSAFSFLPCSLIQTMTSLCVMPLSMTFVKTQPPSPSRLAAWMLFWLCLFFLLFIHHGKFSFQTQASPTSRLVFHPRVCKLFILLIYNPCFPVNYYKNTNLTSPEVFNVWHAGYKELWTNYQRTWKMEVCSCSVIMGDSTCHSSDLSGVSVLHKLLHTPIAFTMHHLLCIKQTICVGSVSLTVSSTLSLLISPNQDSAYQTTFTLAEMEPVRTFSLEVISQLLLSNRCPLRNTGFI